MDETLAGRLKQLFPQASGVSRKDWLARGRVTVNGNVVRDGRTAVSSKDRVALGDETVTRVPLSRQLRLVHEDAYLLVIEKPADVLTIATESERQRTVYRMVWDYLAAARPPTRPLIVHRLDLQTSGLLVLAKSTEAKRNLQAQFAGRSVIRGYHAVVEGIVKADTGVLEDKIVQTSALRVRRAGNDESGRTAITRYRVRDRRATATALDITIGTGRRHQIRVQLAAAGHPIVGDAAYGAATDPIKRVCLHATTLGFLHPGDGAPVRFESPVPRGFARVGRRVDDTARNVPSSDERGPDASRNRVGSAPMRRGGSGTARRSDGTGKS